MTWRNRIAPQISDDDLAEAVIMEQHDFIGSIVLEEEKKALWKAIGGLSHKYRIPILLYYMEELSIADIARLLSIPQGTVKSRLHNARKQLEQELEDYFYE